MADTTDRILELLQNGYHCSQIMMQLTLDLREMDEPFTIRSLGALGGGMFCQRACGTLTGAVCALASYVPRGEGEPEPLLYRSMVAELLTWFEAEHGSLECRDLVGQQMDQIMAYCPDLMARTFEKMLEILEDNEIDPYEPIS